MSSQDYGTVIRQPEPPRKTNKHWFGSMFVVTQVLAGLVAFVIIVWAAAEGSLSSFPAFNYHPLFMVLGLVVVQGESILQYRLMRNPARKTLKFVHVGLMILALAMMIIAFYCVYIYTSGHFSGPHQWMGLVTMILFTWQLLHGFLWRMWPGAPSSLVNWYHGAHAFFGILIFLSACATAMMGMAFDADSDTTFGSFCENIFPLLVVAYAASVVYFVMSPKFRRKDFPHFGGSEAEQPLVFEK